MTERFTLGVCESGLGLTDNETKEQYLEVDDTTLIRLCEVLNGLSEENKRLKFDKSNLHRAMSREEVRHKQFKDKIFCQIDCKIKQLKNCCMVNEAKIIEDLKQELIWND